MNQIDDTDRLVTITEPVSYVTSGSVTVQSPDMTQTVTVLCVTSFLPMLAHLNMDSCE